MTTIPNSCAAIDAAWLNEMLDPSTTGGATVTGVDVDVIGAGVGFMGEVARLTLTYDRPGNGVTSMIAKVPTLEEGPRFLGQLLGFYNKEASFYREIAPEIDVFVPEVYVNLGDPETGDYILLLEDLSPMRPGDQLASCTREEAVGALEQLATLHSHWWDHPRLEDFAGWLPRYGDDFFEMAKGAYLQSIDVFLDTWGDAVPDRVRDALIEDKTDVDGLDRRTAQVLDRPPRTYLHGDYRLDNMLFDANDGSGRVAIIDWQVGRQTNPMFDVVYFLAGNFSPAFRREHERHLVEGYHRSLLAGGVTGYHLEQCWDDYRISSLTLLTYSVIGAGSLDPEATNDRGRELFDVMFERYMGAIVDLDPFSLIV